jgi:hypothetical protein
VSSNGKSEEVKKEEEVFNFLNKTSTSQNIQRQVESNEKTDWSGIFNKSASNKEKFDFRWDSFPNATPLLKFGGTISSSTNVDYLESDAKSNVLEDINWLPPGTSNSEVQKGNFKFLEDDLFAELEAQNTKESNIASSKTKGKVLSNTAGVIK